MDIITFDLDIIYCNKLLQRDGQKLLKVYIIEFVAKHVYCRERADKGSTCETSVKLII